MLEPAGVPTPARQVETATITIGAGFTLLRPTHIDDEHKRLTRSALDMLIACHDPRLLVRQQTGMTDRQSWA